MFYFLEISILCSIVVLDINSNDLSLYIKYSSILLCLVQAVSIYNKKKFSFYYILPLLIISIADYFLLFSNYYIVGVSLFYLVQNFYYYFLTTRVYYGNTFIIFIVLLSLALPIDLLILLTCTYALLSLYNLYLSYQEYPTNQYFLFIIGLLLGCDFFVAMQYLGILIPYSSILIWILYLPSQLYYLKWLDDSVR